MKVLYLGVICIFLILYLFTFKYKKKHRKDIKYKYPFISGMAMYFVDKLEKNKRSCGKRRIHQKFRQLYVKEHIEKEEYIYLVDKVSLSIIAFVLIVSVGAVYTFINTEEQNFLKELERPGYGQVSREYVLEAENESQKETVHIVVKEQQYKQGEIKKLLETSYTDVLNIMLNGNESLSKIERDLRFDSDYGKERINLSWGCENPDVIGYDGKIYPKDENISVKIYLTMTFAGMANTYEIPVTVLAGSQKGISDKIQKVIDSHNVYDSKVKLPEKLDGEKIYFSETSDKIRVPFIVVALVMGVFLYVMKDKDIDKELKKRQEQLRVDYSEIVSKLMLLNSAGMSIRMAWKRILLDYEKQKKRDGMRYVYEEMRLADNKMNSGSSETEVYREFGKRCGLHEYIKLASVLEQNVIKGTRGTKELLEYEVHEAFEERKKIAKKQGDETGTKMLFPMVIMLLISIIIVVVPSFLTMGTTM